MKIKLLQPHEHDGRAYPVGAEITLSKSDAEWLIALNVAEPMPTTKPIK